MTVNVIQMKVLELLDRDHPLTEDGIRQAAELNNRWRLASLHHDHDDIGDSSSSGSSSNIGVGCRGGGDGDAYDGVNGEHEHALMDFSGLGELNDSDLYADDEMMMIPMMILDNARTRHYRYDEHDDEDMYDDHHDDEDMYDNHDDGDMYDDDHNDEGMYDDYHG